MNLSNRMLRALPVMSETIKELDCSENDIEEIQSLPAGLLVLNCSNNPKLKRLPVLPSLLEYLDMSFTDIHTLANIPIHIKHLDISHTKVSVLPPLSDSLRYLYLGHTKIRGIPYFLPAKLEDLNIEGLGLRRLPFLPMNLGHLVISGNAFENRSPDPYAFWYDALLRNESRLNPSAHKPLWAPSLRTILNRLNTYNAYALAYSIRGLAVVTASKQSGGVLSITKRGSDKMISISSDILTNVMAFMFDGERRNPLETLRKIKTMWIHPFIELVESHMNNNAGFQKFLAKIEDDYVTSQAELGEANRNFSEKQAMRASIVASNLNRLSKLHKMRDIGAKVQQASATKYEKQTQATVSELKKKVVDAIIRVKEYNRKNVEANCDLDRLHRALDYCDACRSKKLDHFENSALAGGYRKYRIRTHKKSKSKLRRTRRTRNSQFASSPMNSSLNLIRRHRQSVQSKIK